jgi:hypothetical protein
MFTFFNVFALPCCILYTGWDSFRGSAFAPQNESFSHLINVYIAYAYIYALKKSVTKSTSLARKVARHKLSCQRPSDQNPHFPMWPHLRWWGRHGHGHGHGLFILATYHEVNWSRPGPGQRSRTSLWKLRNRVSWSHHVLHVTGTCPRGENPPYRGCNRAM